MDVFERVIRYYLKENGRTPFLDWYEKLKDLKTRQIVLAHVTRIERGNFGDCHGVGKGVSELRINFGPGYRIYFGFDGMRIVILLLGGDKSSQKKDILDAQAFWEDYMRRK